jgi:uncharacterized protein YfaS (alpha-2-macroglobulin family)
MKRILSILLLFTLFLSAQTYESAWKEVQKFEKKSLPKSSLKKVEEIYQQAKIDKNEIQFIKALFYKEKYLFKLKEEGYITVIHDIEEAINQSPNRSSQLILTSILAQTYSQYLEKSRYYSNRSILKENRSKDIRTWSLKKLAQKSTQLYLASLEKSSQKIDIKRYHSILNRGKGVESLRPTLYDFLAFRALNYFKMVQNFNSFTIKEPDAFNSAYTFMYLSLHTSDKKNYGYQSLLIYQELLKFHQAYHHQKAIDYVDVERLKFVRDNFSSENREELYIKALKRIVQKRPQSEALLELARYYQNRGNLIEALKYVKKGIKSSDKYIFSASQIIKNNIKRRQLEFKVEKVNLPHENILSRISYRNTHELFIKVIKLNPDEREKFTKKNYNEQREYIKSLYAFKNLKINLPKTDDYKQHSTEVSLDSYETGEYIFVLSFQKKINKHSIYKVVNVSNIAYMKQGQKKLLIVHRKTGQPMIGVKTSFYQNRYDRVRGKNETKLYSTIESNEKGEVSIPQLKENYFIIFENKKDRLDIREYNYYRTYQEQYKDAGQSFVQFFTDRAIYRPNQTLYFKGLAVKRFNNKAPKVLNNKKVKVSFFNTNNQRIESKTFTTNEFGTFNGNFTTPKSGLLGSMRIQADIGGLTRVQVEEYKRPKFEVTFKPLKRSYSLEDTIEVIGETKAFAGNRISGAKVTYKVIRSASFPWRYWWEKRSIYQSHEQKIDSGTVKTDNSGQFKINFKAIIDKKVNAQNRPNYNYSIFVDVTDSTGETHSNVKNILLGYVGIQIDMKIASEMNQENNKTVIINSTNLDGAFQAIQGELLIEKILPEPKVYRSRYWEKIDKPLYSKKEFNKLFKNYKYSKNQIGEEIEFIRSIKFNTKIDKLVSLNGLKQGKYRLTLKSFDQKGLEVSKIKYISIYDLKSKEAPRTTYLWHKVDKRHYDTLPTNCKLYLKSNLTDLPVLFTVERDGKVTQERWITVNKVAMELIKITQKDRGNIHYQLTFIQNNRPYTTKGTIQIPWDNSLNIEFISFRDKLKPNEEEQWKLKISGKGKEQAVAEMVATIYDASLEQFKIHKYHPLSYLFPTFNSKYINKWQPQHFSLLSTQTSWQDLQTNRVLRVFSTLKWLLNNSRRDYEEAVPVPMAMVTSRVSAPLQEGENSMSGAMIMYNTSDTKTKSKNNFQPVNIRKNFNETLLFKPHLQTDKEGNIIINFTTNEALTRWNFIAFAHTKDLKTAVVTKTINTSKELMVVTNLPRFFRERDTITLSAKIVNMSKKSLQGECELQLVDPVTQKPIFEKEFKKSFYVEKGSSTVIDFNIKVPDINKVSAIQHTFIARTASHTDAEQIIRPILSNRVFLTESKVLSVKANQEKSFTLKSLKNSNSSTLKNHKLTLEFTSNPAWYAIQSLPYLMEYEHECSEQLFSRYYANVLAQNITKKTPKIKAIFDGWRANKQLKSKLIENQELKSVLLEETPWVLESQNQEQQQKNIALLFDLHKVASEQKKALEKLEKRQLNSGGWSWFGGKDANWYITQYIVEGMGHLKVLGVEKSVNGMLPKAIRYIDQQIVKEYESLMKSIENGYKKEEDDNLNSMIIHYLYARSFFKQKMNSKTETAHDYYLNQAKKYWTTKAIYEKGLIALSLHRIGESSQDIVASIKEHVIRSDELGAYFQYSNGYYWNELPIETHTLMIEVFETIAQDKKMVEALKIWLLKQRQTGHWKTTKATSSAIYALLSNSDWLSSDELVNVTFDTQKNYQKKLKEAQSKAVKGLGYYKVSYNSNQFDSSMATVKVTNPNSTIAWGGLYWQYFEDMDRVKTFKETPITIEKKLFLIEQTKNGEQLIPVEDQVLRIGETIKVRISIYVNRDMEYVMLKDSRASTFEPLNVISQYKWQDGLGYYESTKDNATYFFIDYLKKGTYVFEYPLIATHKGVFSNGITTIESMYAPEFKSHSEGVRVFVR